MESGLNSGHGEKRESGDGDSQSRQAQLRPFRLLLGGRWMTDCGWADGQMADVAALLQLRNGQWPGGLWLSLSLEDARLHGAC